MNHETKLNTPFSIRLNQSCKKKYPNRNILLDYSVETDDIVKTDDVVKADDVVETNYIVKVLP